MVRSLLFAVLCSMLYFPSFSQVTPDFIIPDTVCVNTPITIRNTSVGATSYYWNFCTANLSNPPTVTDLGNIGGLFSTPVFMDYVSDNGKYYGFVTNHYGGNLIRLDFGNSLLNTPVATNLGNFGGILPIAFGNEGIQVVKQNGNWFAIITGGHDVSSSTSPRIVKIEFGTNIANPAPIATNWGNIGNMDFPMDLHLYEDAGRWFGITINSQNNTITRIDFTNSFSNVPVATNLGNIGGLDYPTGIFVTTDKGKWYAFVANQSETPGQKSTITRLDFGNSLNNTPTGTNLGKMGGLLYDTRDITILKSCDQTIGFAINGGPSSTNIIRLDFNNDLSSVPVASVAGNLVNGTFPHCISKLFRDKSSVYGFVMKAYSHSLTRLEFAGCINASIPATTQKDPPVFSYDAPGTYNINLTIDDGLPTQQMICKKIVVQAPVPSDFSYEQEICDPLTVRFTNSNTAVSEYQWTLGDGTTVNNTLSPSHQYSAYGNFQVTFTVLKNKCTPPVGKIIPLHLGKEDIVLTPDTTICDGVTKQLRSLPSVDVCWYPSIDLSNPRISNPVTSTRQNITYYCTIKKPGPNLVTNGDFEAGNTGFTSEYNYKTPPNINGGEYYIGENSQDWNPLMSPCLDHTTGKGKMMIVNGATIPGVRVWYQSIPVKPNTNYAFSIWIETVNNADPARLRFTINNQEVGSPINSGAACTWMQLYTTWNSGNQTTAEIAVVNKSTVFSGNDFGLDDISFTEVTTVYDSVKITVENPSVNAGADAEICTRASVKLGATGANTWNWSPAAGLSDPAIANPMASPANTTEYTVTGTTIHGCVATDKVTINVIGQPVLDKTPDTLVCNNTPIPLRAVANGNYSYSWTPAAALNNASTAKPTIPLLKTPTKFYVQITDLKNCITRDSVLVDVRPQPDFRAKLPDAVCYNTSSKFEASGGDTYTWAPADQLDDPHSPTPSVKAISPLKYTVLISEKTCGHDSLVKFAPLRINPLPNTDATKMNDINCVTTSAQLLATGAVTYNWFPASAVDNPYRRDPKTLVDTTTQFIVKGTNQFGCTANDTIVVYVTKTGTPIFEIPNAFTPNHDGKNDCFGIGRWPNIKLESLEIYNRWGQKIFHGTKSTDCWDGTFKGKPQNSGEYIYIIKAATFCGPLIRKGVLFLIR